MRLILSVCLLAVSSLAHAQAPDPVLSKIDPCNYTDPGCWPRATSGSDTVEHVLLDPSSPQQYNGMGFWLQGIDTRLIPPGSWSFGAGVDHHKVSGGGHVAAFDARLWVHASNATQPGDQLVGADTFCFTESGGSCYGLNAYVGYYSPSPPTGTAHGGEVDTDVRVPAQRKVGLLLADVAHSRASGASKDTAIWITKQLSATPETDPVGYMHAINVSGELGAALFPIRQEGSLFYATGGTTWSGLDFSGMSFPGGGFVMPAGVVIRVGGHTISTDGRSYISICGGTSVSVCYNVEQDWMVVRRGGPAPLAYTFDWETGTFVRQ